MFFCHTDLSDLTDAFGVPRYKRTWLQRIDILNIGQQRSRILRLDGSKRLEVERLALQSKEPFTSPLTFDQWNRPP